MHTLHPGERAAFQSNITIAHWTALVLVLHISEWPDNINISIDLLDQAQVAIDTQEGTRRQRLSPNTTGNMYHLERSQAIILPASIQQMLRWVPSTTHGRAWRPPPKNPIMVDNDWTQCGQNYTKGIVPLEKSVPTRSTSQCMKSLSQDQKISRFGHSSTINFFHQKLCAGNATECSSNVPTPTSATAGATRNTANVDKQERTHTLTNSWFCEHRRRPISAERTEEEDFDTISLGSDTDWKIQSVSSYCL